MECLRGLPRLLPRALRLLPRGLCAPAWGLTPARAAGPLGGSWAALPGAPRGPRLAGTAPPPARDAAVTSGPSPARPPRGPWAELPPEAPGAPLVFKSSVALTHHDSWGVKIGHRRLKYSDKFLPCGRGSVCPGNGVGRAGETWRQELRRVRADFAFKCGRRRNRSWCVFTG